MSNEITETKEKKETKETKKMTLIQKMAEARSRLSKMPIKRSGQNAAMRVGYIQLNDFLPQINQLNAELGILPVINFYKAENVAEMTIYDSDSDETLVFNSPLGNCSLKGVQEIQNEGAVQTYVRRYLYMNAYEISETDILDAKVAERKETLTNILVNDFGCDLTAIASYFHVADPSKLTDDMLLTALKKKSQSKKSASESMVEALNN